jgi:hypothetical protein
MIDVALTRVHVTTAVPVAVPVVAIDAILTVPHAEEPASTVPAFATGPPVAGSVPADFVRILAEEPLSF